MVYAVIDTNVLVSFFICKNSDSAPSKVLREAFGGKITPIYNIPLIKEYRTVLSRKKFGLDKTSIDLMLDDFQNFGIGVESFEPLIRLLDPKDAPILDVALMTREMDSYLVTGNLKHFPDLDYVISPRQMVDLLEKQSA